MIDRTVVLRLAALSRISLTEEEADRIRSDIEQIVGYVSEIREADFDARSESETGAVYNVLREDAEAHESGIFSERLISAAPRRVGAFVRVKKIL